MLIRTNKTSLPDKLLNIIDCNCKAGCQTKRCSCKSLGVSCNNLCHSGRNTQCQNVENIIDEIDEQPDFRDFREFAEEDICNYEEAGEEDIYPEENISDIYNFSDDEEDEEIFQAPGTDSEISTSYTGSETSSTNNKKENEN